MDASNSHIRDGVYTTINLLGKQNVSPETRTGALTIPYGGAWIGQDLRLGGSVELPDGGIVAGDLQLINGAVKGFIVRAVNDNGVAEWSRDGDDRFIGDFGMGETIAYTYGYMGVGITNPTELFHVNGNIRIEEDIIFSNSDSNLEFPGIFTVNTDKLYLSSTGYIGIGTTATETFETIGNIKLGGEFVQNTEHFSLPPTGDILTGVSQIHTLYNKTLYEPVITNNMDFELSGRIINLNDPINEKDAVNKLYVDNLINGLDWQESVLRRDLYDEPLSPIVGDRYLIPVGATGAWAGQDNKIVIRITDTGGDSWLYISPDLYTTVFVENEDKQWTYNGTEWVLIGTIASHSNLQDLDVDDHLQYFLLEGRSGGQTMYGGKNSNDYLIIHATNNASPSEIYLNPDGGFVAIGITDAETVLHTKSQSGIENINLIDTSSNTDNSTLQLRINGVNNNSWKIFNEASTGNFIIHDENEGDRLIIEPGVSSAIKIMADSTTEWARFDNGYLGIGTTNVFERLIVGDISHDLNETIRLQSNDHSKLQIVSNIPNTTNSEVSTIELLTKNNTKCALITLVGEDNQFVNNTLQDSLLIGSTSSGKLTDINFTTNGEISMIIKENSYVGISQHDPNAQLVINNNLEAHNGLTIGSTGSDIGVKIGQSEINYLDIFWNYNSTSSDSYAEITTKDSSNDLILQSNDGNVGIGITQPDDRLHVEGNIKLTGTINQGTEAFTLPSLTDTLIARNSVDIITNKSFKDTTVKFVNADDITKTLYFDLSGALPNTCVTFVLEQTDNRVITFPDSTDIVVGVSTTQTLTNKDLSGNIIEDFTNQGTTFLMPILGVTGDNTMVARDTIDTLRNKTLVNPVIFGDVSVGDSIVTDKIKAKDQTGILVLDIFDNVALYIEDGGQVGVGTTGPEGDLHVVGDLTILDTSLNVDNNTLYVGATTNQVGINTDNPLADFHVNGDVQVDNDLVVDGNLTVNGTQFVIDSVIVTVEDPLVKYAKNNTADIVDIGFYGCYVDSGVTKLTGFYRDASGSKPYRLFDGLEVEPSGNVVDIGATGYNKANLVLKGLDAEEITYSTNLLFNTNEIVFTTAGEIGINTVSPNEKLHVNGGAQIGTEFYVKTEGKVGLHTSTPFYKTDINSSTRITGSSTNVLTGTADPDGTTTLNGSGTLFLSELEIGDSITVNSETRTVTFINSDTSLTVNTAFTDTSASTITRNPSLFIVRDNSDNIDFIINNDGNIGIGATSTNYPLQISKDYPNNWSTKIENGETTMYLAHANGLGMNINTGNTSDTSYALKISNNTHPLLRLQNDNKLGIGTDSPSELLHIEGTNTGDGALIGNAKIGVWEGSADYTAFTHNTVHGTTGSYAVKQFNTGETHINSASGKDLHFSIDDQDIMVIKPDGSVGINTATPTKELHVEGGSLFTKDLCVNGDLIIGGVIEAVSATSIVVQDPIFKLADGNTSDIIDSGFYAQYNDGIDRYMGWYRDDADGKFKIFYNLSEEPGTTQVNNQHESYRNGALVIGELNIQSGTTQGLINFLDGNDNPVNQIISDENGDIVFGTSGIFYFESMGNTVAYIDENSNFGISGTFNIANLSITSSLTTEYDLFVGGVAAFGDISVSGTLSVGTFGVSGDGIFSGNIIAEGDLTVGGELTLESIGTTTDLNVGNDANITNNLSVSGNATIGGNMLIDGNLRLNVLNTSSNLTLNENHSWIIVDASGGEVVITLPQSHDYSIPSYIGSTFHIVKKDTSSNKVRIVTSGTDIIDGSFTEINLLHPHDRSTVGNVGGLSNIGLWYTM